MSNHEANGSKVLRSNKIKQIINHVTDLEESLQIDQYNRPFATVGHVTDNS